MTPTVKRPLPLITAAIVFATLCLSSYGQDSAGGVKVSTLLRKDGTKEVTTTDSDNHTSETQTYAQGDKLLKRVVYTLDEQSLPLQGLVYDPKGRLLYKSLYKRDVSGRVTEEVEFSADDKPLGRFVYHYNSGGGVAKIDAYDANGNVVSQAGASLQNKQSLPRRHH